MYEEMEENEVLYTVQEAIRCGINYIDTAPWYGQGRSEEMLGKVLKKVPRQAYYIGTKVGRYERNIENMFDYSAEKIRQGVDKSLQLLGLDYVDIIQVHDVELAEVFAGGLDEIVNETLPTLQDIVCEGKARFIGITGYPLGPLRKVIERSKVKIDSVLTYAKCTLIDDEIHNYLPYFEEKKLGVINAGVIAMGLLASTGPQPWHPAPNDIKEACRQAKEHCKELNVSLANLAIQYSLMAKGVSTHVIGFGSSDILKQNLESAINEPTENCLRLMKELKKRYFEPLRVKNWEKYSVQILLDMKTKADQVS